MHLSSPLVVEIWSHLKARGSFLALLASRGQGPRQLPQPALGHDVHPPAARIPDLDVGEAGVHAQCQVAGQRPAQNLAFGVPSSGFDTGFTPGCWAAACSMHGVLLRAYSGLGVHAQRQVAGQSPAALHTVQRVQGIMIAAARVPGEQSRGAGCTAFHVFLGPGTSMMKARGGITKLDQQPRPLRSGCGVNMAPAGQAAIASLAARQARHGMVMRAVNILALLAIAAPA